MVFQSTCRHRGETHRNSFAPGWLESTRGAHTCDVTRSKSGTCTTIRAPYIRTRHQRGRDRALLGPRLLMGPGGSLGEGADANKGTGVR